MPEASCETDLPLSPAKQVSSHLDPKHPQRNTNDRSTAPGIQPRKLRRHSTTAARRTRARARRRSAAAGATRAARRRSRGARRRARRLGRGAGAAGQRARGREAGAGQLLAEREGGGSDFCFGGTTLVTEDQISPGRGGRTGFIGAAAWLGLGQAGVDVGCDLCLAGCALAA